MCEDTMKFYVVERDAMMEREAGSHGYARFSR